MVGVVTRVGVVSMVGVVTRVEVPSSSGVVRVIIKYAWSINEISNKFRFYENIKLLKQKF